MPRLSVIVPVYNTDKYLIECIKSILNQTFTDIEIVCVNDGSTDNSLEILKEYEKKYSNVIVINQENGGPVIAKRAGVEKATGEYVSFVDSDDWIDRDMYERLLSYADEYNCDMVCSGLYRQFGSQGVLNQNTVSPGFYDKQSLIKSVYPYMLCDGNFFQMGVRPNLVGKIVKRELIYDVQKVAPNDVTNGDDAMLVYPCLLKSSRVYLTDEAWYHYRQHSESISQKKAFRVQEKNRTIHLIDFMKNQFLQYSSYEHLLKQLKLYTSHFVIQREPEAFDDTLGQLRMFGYIGKNDKIAIYGAGRFGKQIYYYATENGRNVIWVDKNSSIYKEQGLPVEDVQTLLSEQYDVILVAVIDSRMISEIKHEIESMGVASEIIKSLDIDYITSDVVFDRIGL